MAKSVYGLPHVNEVCDKEAYDLSHVININGKAGMMLPFYHRLFYTGEKCRLNVDAFFRLAPVNSPAFPTMDLHYEFFKVPLKQLYSNWGAFRENIKDVYSSAPQLSNVQTALPYFTRGDMISYAYRFNNRYNLDGSSVWSGVKRLLDLFNYGLLNAAGNLIMPVDTDQAAGTSASDPAFMNERFSLFPALAYQKVYYDHFRNTHYEGSQVSVWNIDNYAQGLHDANMSEALGDYFRLRFVNVIKDYFHNFYPSLNFTSTQTTGVSWSLPKDFVNFPVYGNSRGQGVFVDTDGVGASGSASVSFASSATSVQSIRAAFALDKLLRASAYAPQRVVDQYRARFGVTPKNELNNMSTRLGSFKVNVVIGEVTSTADTDNAGLGVVGGKGVGAGAKGGTIDFTADCDCIVLGICYLLPRLSYDALFTDPQVQLLDTFDFPQPEFMRLGLRALYSKNVLRTSYTGEGSTDFLSGSDNQIVGYTLPDFYYKSSPNVNHGLFIKGRSLNAYVVHAQDVQLSEYIYEANFYPYFKLLPQVLNPIMKNQVDGTEETDQYFGQIIIHNPSVRMFPVFGQPII